MDGRYLDNDDTPLCLWKSNEISFLLLVSLEWRVGRSDTRT
jgi:hypothetical protein